jgi:hypothetical protein
LFLEKNAIFPAENCDYNIDPRSTPRSVPGRMSKEEYVETVVRAIKDCRLPIVVKYLISIDRRGSVADAEAAVQVPSLRLPHVYTTL